MGNSVVNVKYVKVVLFAHFSHFYREGKRVVRVFKQGIVIYLHFMKMNVRATGIKSEGDTIANKVHLMTALCQLMPKFRSDNSAAADFGITGDSDVQWFLHGDFSS